MSPAGTLLTVPVTGPGASANGSLVRLYTKSGYDCTTRFVGLSSSLAALPARSCIIDGEVTAFDPLGLIDSDALHAVQPRDRRVA
jgi:ATP-dependent DNA ligase